MRTTHRLGVLAMLAGALLLGTSGAASAGLPCSVTEPLRTAALQNAAQPQRAASLQTTEQRPIVKFKGDRFARTELFFGSARPGGEVSQEEFKEFLDQCVTPRFPDGLTLLAGLGQFRGADGVAIEERSMLVILLYPENARKESSRRIEEIREAYKQIFQQESVLRADRCCEDVAF